MDRREREADTEDRMALNELMQKAGDGDFLRSLAETVLQMLMEADVEGLIGARRHADREHGRMNHSGPLRRANHHSNPGSLTHDDLSVPANLHLVDRRYPTDEHPGRFSPHQTSLWPIFHNDQAD